MVQDGPQHAFFDRLGATVKERHVLHGFFHDTLGERDRSVPIARMRTFLLRRFDSPPAIPDVTDADLAGFTREEADALAAPLPPLSPRGLYWSATRAGLQFGATMSDGVRLGQQTGFDSGSTLDYVYRNVATGVTPLGRLIDRNYLRSIGWTGIRQRKLHLEELLRNAIADRRANGAPVRIVDVAAATAATCSMRSPRRSCPMRSSCATSWRRTSSKASRSFVRAPRGRRLVRARGRVRPGGHRRDRTAADHRHRLRPVRALRRQRDGPRIARRARRRHRRRRLLVYTGQPWHPQLELIARGLTSHRGGAWVMRRRTQMELDQLVSAAGFRKIDQRIDQWGIFTVSLARRIPR